MADPARPGEPDGPGGAHRFGLSWLAGLGRDSLDPGYAEAADRRRHGSAGGTRKAGRTRAVGWLVLAMVLTGVTVGIAVRSNQINAPDAAKARSGILADIDRAQQRAGDLEGSATSLAQQIRSRQQALGAGGPLQTVGALQAQAAMTPVQGPGLQVVIDRAASSNVILDRDVQLLVNGLWAADAEAISVGGVRLKQTSAIRQAGSTILVDNKPTFWPITIDAIGPADTMHVAFAATTGYARFAGFAANYGIIFTVKDAADLSLAAAPQPEQRYAEPGTATSDTSVGPAAPTTGPTR